MVRYAYCAPLAAVCLIFGATLDTAAADPVADFYRGKKITAVVPFGSGGSYGLFTQMAARHMPKHIPGNPVIVPQYMPGAGGNKATSYVYNVAARDGSYIAMVPDGLVISSVLRPNKIKYKPAEFTWIGSMERFPTVLMVRGDSGFRSIADLFKGQLILSSSGRGSQSFLTPALLRWLTGAKIKIVQGYKGVRKMMNAMERGETQGVSVGYSAWLNLKADWLKSGYIFPLVQFGVRKESDLPDTPLAIDLAKTPEAKAVTRFMASSSEIGRSFVVPPKVPGDRIAALRTAFDKMVKDPGFLAEVKKRRLIIDPAPGAQIQKAVNRAAAIDPKIAKLMRTAIFGAK